MEQGIHVLLGYFSQLCQRYAAQFGGNFGDTADVGWCIGFMAEHKRAVGFENEIRASKACKAARTFFALGLSSSEPMPILKPSFTKIRASSTLPEKA